MKSGRFHISFAAAFLVLAFALPAVATEPIQPLLAELIRPNAPMLAPLEEPALITTEYINAGESHGSSDPADLFTLEELRGRNEDNGEMPLPDGDLPISDIPLTLNSKVEYFLYYFQTKGRGAFSRWLSRSSRYIPMMKEILRSEGIPEDMVYLAMIESGFKLHARSWANAVGPWQFMSGTGKHYSLRIDQWIDERKNPVKATTAAAIYLKELYTLFKGDWYLAAAGYNAGENKILRAISMYNTSDFWEIARRPYLKRETKEYVPKLLAAALIAKDPARYGFTDVAYMAPIEFDTVTIPSRTDLELAARLSGTTNESIRELNPDLRHWCTPPNYPDYLLKIPKGSKERFETEYAKIAVDQRFTEKVLYTKYKVRKNDSLKGIAQRFGVTVGVLAELNGLSKKGRIAGKSLLIPVKQTVNFGTEGLKTTKADNKGTLYKYYTVKKGDTLYSLSKRFKTSTKLLTSWNMLKDKVVLKAGRRIIVAKFVNRNGEMLPVAES